MVFFLLLFISVVLVFGHSLVTLEFGLCSVLVYVVECCLDVSTWAEWMMEWGLHLVIG